MSDALHQLLSPSTVRDRIALIARIIDWDPSVLDAAIQAAETDPHAATISATVMDTIHHARPTPPADPSAVLLQLTPEQRVHLHNITNGQGTAAQAIARLLDQHLAQARPCISRPATQGEISATEKAACARREVEYRRMVYANRAGGTANIKPYFLRQIAVMEAIQRDYETLAAAEPAPADAQLSLL